MMIKFLLIIAFRIALTSLFLSPVYAVCQNNTKGITDDQKSQIDALFASYDNETPGCAVNVIIDGVSVYKKGFGLANLEHNIPITCNTVFNVGSVSKQFTAAIIALLEEEGRLSFGDDVRKYVPEMPDYGKEITIQHLINHTSGIREYFNIWFLRGKNIYDTMPKEEVLDLIVTQKDLNFAPGTDYSYSNSNYFLLRIIIERITGKAISEAGEDYIFKPLRMMNTLYINDKFNIVNNDPVIKGRADNYRTKENGVYVSTPIKSKISGSSGVFSTIDDMEKWVNNFSHNRLGLSSQSLIDRMTESGVLEDSSRISYAFGLMTWDYKNVQSIRHGGTIGNYRSYMVMIPRFDFSTIVLCNVLEASPFSLTNSITDIMLAEHLEEPEEDNGENSMNRDNEEEHKIILTKSELDKYTGSYFCEELLSYHDIYREGNELHLKIGYLVDLVLKPVGLMSFRSGKIKLEFRENSNGEIVSYSLDASRSKGLSCYRKSNITY